jgi:hypothetical protein
MLVWCGIGSLPAHFPWSELLNAFGAGCAAGTLVWLHLGGKIVEHNMRELDRLGDEYRRLESERS